jgi:hypothetical protein
MRFEEEFGIEIPDEDAERFRVCATRITISISTRSEPAYRSYMSYRTYSRHHYFQGVLT